MAWQRGSKKQLGLEMSISTWEGMCVLSLSTWAVLVPQQNLCAAQHILGSLLADLLTGLEALVSMRKTAQSVSVVLECMLKAWPSAEGREHVQGIQLSHRTLH